MGAGHTHTHAHDHGAELRIGRAARAGLLGTLAVALLLTLVGLIWLWPDGDRAAEVKGSVAFSSEGVTYVPGIVVGLEGDTGVRAQVAEGPEAGTEVVVEVPPPMADAGLVEGDELELIRMPPAQEAGSATYGFFGVERDAPLLLLLAVFVVVVLVVARFRGLMALMGLGFAGLVLGVFLLPALLTGEPAVPVTLVGSTLIMFVVLYTTHGVSLRTSTALVGTLGGVAVTALVAWWSVGATRLSGSHGEAANMLTSYAPQLSLQGLLLAAVIVAGLGVLNDVTITQASAVWELRAAAPELSRRQLFASGMRIGRDHIASSIYTIVFAYAGTALLVLLVMQLYDRSALQLVSTEEIAEEVMRSLASSIGLVLAVPITTVIAALTVAGSAPAAGPGKRRRVT
jgi:uncharacterized membrane protein